MDVIEKNPDAECTLDLEAGHVRGRRLRCGVDAAERRDAFCDRARGIRPGCCWIDTRRSTRRRAPAPYVTGF